MLGAREQFLERVDDPVPVVHPNPNQPQPNQFAL